MNDLYFNTKLFRELTDKWCSKYPFMESTKSELLAAELNVPKSHVKGVMAGHCNPQFVLLVRSMNLFGIKDINTLVSNVPFVQDKKEKLTCPEGAKYVRNVERSVEN